MNFSDIITEELKAADERIRARMTALLLGDASVGTVPAATPSLSFPRQAVTNRFQESRTEAAIQRADDVERFLDYLKDHPGSLGPDIIRALDFTNSKDKRYVNLIMYVQRYRLVMRKGKGTRAAWYIAGKGNQGNQGGSGKKTRAKAENRVLGEDARVRDDKIVRVLEANPWVTPQGLRDLCLKRYGPDFGTNSAVACAIVRLRERKVINSRRGSGKSRGGKAPVDLKVK